MSGVKRVDVFSHGLWGGLVLGRQGGYSLAAAFGMMPDILAFGPHLLISLCRKKLVKGKPKARDFGIGVQRLYNITHSFITSGIIFTVLFFVDRSIAYLFLAWPLHIIFDIPTHRKDFFPTKFLYPLSSFHFDGVEWSNKYIMTGNLLLLLGSYIWFYYK